MDVATWFSIGGLVLDIIGVTLIWRFGLPQNVKRGGVSYLRLEQDDPIEDTRAKRYDLISAFGLALLIGGFVSQIVGQLARSGPG